MSTYLITGGAGFIGSHLSEYLAKEGHEVRIIDDLSTGKRENVAHIQGTISFYEGSILDQELLAEAMAGVQYVFHQAALPSVPVSIERPYDTNNANITGTLSVFEAARKAGVKRVVYASSSSVYGDSPTLPKVETMPYNPLSPYAAQKMMCEYYGKLYSRIYGLETVGLRYFNVFGPRQNPHSEYSAVIPKFIKRVLHGDPITIYGDGETTRDFTYIDNVVDANVQASLAERASGEVFNIACGSRISLNELIEKICTECGKRVEPSYADFRGGDIKHSVADITKATTLLGYQPKVNFDEGLKMTIQFLHDH